jgi:S1-C subfamily serine protease
MKKLLTVVVLWVFLVLPAWAAPPGLIADHEKMIYPVVRVTEGRSAGSGTVIYCQAKDGKYDTYVLTNHHVIADAITVTEEWSPIEKKDVKTERRSVVYVEIFQYRDLSVPVGTLKIEADVVAYSRNEDMALIKLRSDKCIDHVADLAPEKSQRYILDVTYAVGCSLAFPPLPTAGIITRLNMLIDSLPFHMSSAQIIYGNSGGAMFNADRELIGIPSRGMVAGWGTPVTHMGFFIPIDRFYAWAKKEEYDFLFEE